MNHVLYSTKAVDSINHGNFFIIYFYFICVCVAYMYVSAHVSLNAYCGQNRVLDSLELTLWTVVSLYVGAGIRTWIFCKNSS